MTVHKPLLAAVLAAALTACTGGGTTGEPTASPETAAAESPTEPVGAWWAGEIHAVSTLESQDESTTCTEVWDIDLDLYDNKGQVTGSGNGDLIAARTCQSDDPAVDFKAQAKHFEFNVRGELAKKGFAIQLILTRSNGEFLGGLNQSLFYQGGGEQPRTLEVPVTQRGVVEVKLVIKGVETDQGNVTGSHRFLFVCQVC
jgi:hypothetical protein